MDQAFDALFESDEGTVVDDAHDLAVNPLADRVLLGNENPGILETLLVSQRNPLTLAIEA